MGGGRAARVREMRRMTVADRAWWRPGLGAGSAPIVLGMSYWWTREELLSEMTVKLVNLKQGSKEWHKWRKAGVGASESAAILGINPWESREGLLESKTSGKEAADDNVNTRRGKRLESTAREMYERMMGWKMRPVCALHDTHDFIRASLDGLREDGKLLLEIKCPTARWHEASIEAVPDWYKCQVQHQILVTGATKAHFVSYCKTHKAHPFVLKTIEADPEFQSILLGELIRFWGDVEASLRGRS